MSTKSSILLSTDNEHWYKEGNARYYEETSTEECMVIAIDSRHNVEEYEGGIRIIIEDGTPLFNELLKLL